MDSKTVQWLSFLYDNYKSLSTTLTKLTLKFIVSKFYEVIKLFKVGYPKDRGNHNQINFQNG